MAICTLEDSKYIHFQPTSPLPPQWMFILPTVFHSMQFSTDVSIIQKSSVRRPLSVNLVGSEVCKVFGKQTNWSLLLILGWNMGRKSNDGHQIIVMFLLLSITVVKYFGHYDCLINIKISNKMIFQVVIASMRQLVSQLSLLSSSTSKNNNWHKIEKVRLKEGKTAKITDIPGFLTQCMQSKVKIL